ncbi:putative 11-S seed storage protein, plant [Helianthus anomalus]
MAARSYLNRGGSGSDVVGGGGGSGFNSVMLTNKRVSSSSKPLDSFFVSRSSHCFHKFKVNIENPSQADFVNPQASSIANLNSFKFPILEHLQLSVERRELHLNAIQSPHWTINAHNLLYVTEGALRVQIVDNQGNSVFDNELREGQVVVIPQNFAVIKRANEQGSRWVSFKTNDNAMIANLAGRVSAISSMPVDVVANAYQLSREEAQQLKFSQRETVLFAPSFSRGQGRASA